MPTTKQLGELESARQALKEIPHQAFQAFECLANKEYERVRAIVQNIRVDAGIVDRLCYEILKGGD